MPYPSHSEGSLAPLAEIQVDDKVFRKAELDRRWKVVWEAHAKGNNVLVCDLPPKAVSSSPLKKLPLLSVAERRMLVGWWLGSFPGHNHERCLVCGVTFPEVGVRAHAASCANATLPVPMDTERLLRSVEEKISEEDQARRLSNDAVTLAIWEFFSMEPRNREYGALKQVCDGLKAVAEECLGRRRAPAPASASASSGEAGLINQRIHDPP